MDRNLRSRSTSTDRVGFMSRLLVSLLALSNGALAAPTDGCMSRRDFHDINTYHVTRDGITVITTETDNDALDYAEHLYLQGVDLAGLTLYSNDTGSMIEDISIVDESSDRNVGLAKRWSCSSAPLGTHFTQRQTKNSTTSWTDWSNASGCDFTRGSENSVDLKDYTVHSTTDKGYSFHVAEQDAKTQFGVKISKKYTDVNGVTSCTAAGKPVAIWAQNKVYVSTQRTQKCNRHYYGKHGCKCGDWSKDINGQVPIANGTALQYGCSSGKESGCSL